MEKSEESLENLVKRFDNSKKNFIECEALQYDGHVYVVAKKTTTKKKHTRRKRWYFWMESWGLMRGPISYNTVPAPFDKEIILTSNPCCKKVTKVSSDFFFINNRYYCAEKSLLFDPETKTVFSVDSRMSMAQIFQVESED